MRARYGAGLAVQVFASATNFGLTVLASQATGPSGLGTVYAGFAAYAAVFGLQRAFITTPLITASSARTAVERQVATSAALTLVLASAFLACLGFLAVGWIVGGTVGTGLVLFAPWLVPALIQLFWRSVFFRDGRTRRALVTDAAWFVLLILLAPLAVTLETETAVVATWGVGSTVAAFLAWGLLRQRPASPRAAWEWWRTEASAFGSWLAVQEVVFIVSGFGLVLVLAAVLGSTDLGGFRAAESVFAPISLIGPAIGLPGLPAISRAVSRSLHEARRLATRLSGIAVAMTVVYLLIMLLLGDQLLSRIFGTEFAGYGDLVWPFGTWQTITALAIGFSLLLSAQQRGKALLTAGAIGSISALVVVTLLAFRWGAMGAAWGLALSASLSTTATLALARGRRVSA